MFFYGTNINDNTPITYDRTDFTKVQHRAIFGASGSGKTFIMKSEIVQILKNANETVLVLDYDRNYIRMAEQLGGNVIHVTKSSIDCVNPVTVPDASGLVVLDIEPMLFSIEDRQFATYMCLAAMWEKIEAADNSENGNNRFWIYIDDIMPLLSYPRCEELFLKMITKSRTHGCAITYGASSFAEFRDTRNGLQAMSNTPLISLLNQTKRDSDLIAECLNLSYEEQNRIIGQHCGKGLFIVNNEKIPFNSV